MLCVGYADEADAWRVGRDRGRGVRKVEPTCEGKEGRRHEAVPGGGISTMDNVVEATHRGECEATCCHYSIESTICSSSYNSRVSEMHLKR